MFYIFLSFKASQRIGSLNIFVATAYLPDRLGSVGHNFSFTNLLASGDVGCVVMTCELLVGGNEVFVDN